MNPKDLLTKIINDKIAKGEPIFVEVPPLQDAINREPYTIGTKFCSIFSAGKEIFTLVDIHRTINNAGGVVRTEYIGERDYIGQKLTGKFNATAIARGIAKINGLPH